MVSLILKRPFFKKKILKSPIYGDVSLIPKRLLYMVTFISNYT